ncbi:MAG TPA: serine/threonine-protein kinase [Kofleriaceae bacterium]
MTEQLGGRVADSFGPFHIHERLGTGGMAVVHRAVRRRADGSEQTVALKRLLPHLAEDAAFIRAFAREARMAQSLQHENICHIHELGRVGESYFISMELLEGSDLRALLRRSYVRGTTPPLTAALSLLVQLCAALDHAHNAVDPDTGDLLGLVHRDVSPANVLVLPDGVVKVIDFGIAKATLSKVQTETGRFRGKLGYLSPEAIQGQAVDGRSDIFSVGVIAYELVTGKPLFGSVSDFETLSRVQFGQVDPPSSLNPKVPPELDEAIMSALAKDPSDRWPSAATMGEALGEVVPGPSKEALAEWCSQARRERPAPGPLSRGLSSGSARENPIAQVVDLVWGATGSDPEIPALPEVPDLSGAPPERDTILMSELERPVHEDTTAAPDHGETIKMQQLLRDPSNFETVEIEKLEQITSASETVKVPALASPSSVVTEQIASRRRRLVLAAWRQRWDQVQLTIAALILLLSPLGREEPALADAPPASTSAALADDPSAVPIAAAPVQAPASCRLSVTSRPRQALVWIDDKVIGDTPLDAEVDCSGGLLAIEKDRYKPVVRPLSFEGQSDVAVDVSLSKRRNAKRRTR